MARKIDKEKIMNMKNKIINSAIEIILEKGFSQLTLSKVANKLNITKATIYWYFSSKEDLIENISNKICVLELDEIKNIYKMDISSKEKLYKLIYRESNKFSCILPIKFLLEFYSEESEIKLKIQDSYKKFQETLAIILKEGKEKKEFDYDISEDDIAKCIISLLDGIAINNFTLDKVYNPISNETILTILESIIKFKEIKL